MFKRLLIIAPLILMTACAKVKTTYADPTLLDNLHNKTVTVSAHPEADKSIVSTGPVIASVLVLGLLAPLMFEPIGLITGESKVEEFDLKDPSILTAQIVSEKLEELYGIQTKNADRKLFIESGNSIENLTGIYQKTDYIMSVKTTMWRLETMIMNNVTYQAEMRLIDTETKEDVAAVVCKYESGKYNNEYPSYNDWFENDAELLKSRYQQAAHHCANKFIKYYLGIK